MARHLRLTIDLAYEDEKGNELTDASIAATEQWIRDAAEMWVKRGFLVASHTSAVVDVWSTTGEDETTQG